MNPDPGMSVWRVTWPIMGGPDPHGMDMLVGCREMADVVRAAARMMRYASFTVRPTEDPRVWLIEPGSGPGPIRLELVA